MVMISEPQQSCRQTSNGGEATPAFAAKMFVAPRFLRFTWGDRTCAVVGLLGRLGVGNSPSAEEPGCRRHTFSSRFARRMECSRRTQDTPPFVSAKIRVVFRRGDSKQGRG